MKGTTKEDYEKARDILKEYGIYGDLAYTWAYKTVKEWEEKSNGRSNRKT